jgi:hypothetical protein
MCSIQKVRQHRGHTLQVAVRTGKLRGHQKAQVPEKEILQLHIRHRTAEMVPDRMRRVTECLSILRLEARELAEN